MSAYGLEIRSRPQNSAEAISAHHHATDDVDEIEEVLSRRTHGWPSRVPARSEKEFESEEDLSPRICWIVGIYNVVKVSNGVWLQDPCIKKVVYSEDEGRELIVANQQPYEKRSILGVGWVRPFRKCG